MHTVLPLEKLQTNLRISKAENRGNYSEPPPAVQCYLELLGMRNYRPWTF